MGNAEWTASGGAVSEIAGPEAPRSRRDGVTPLGEQLRAERERRGTALGEVAEATKIRKTYLEALEVHDWKALPADVFTRGYLRSYAEYLGLDQEHLLKLYARERRIAGEDTPSASARAQRDDAKALIKKLARARGVKVRRFAPRVTWMALGLGGGGVVAIALWTFLHLPRSGSVESTAIAPLPSSAERPSVAAPPVTRVLAGEISSPEERPSVAAPPVTRVLAGEISSPAERPSVAAPAVTSVIAGEVSSPPRDVPDVAPTAKQPPAPPAEPRVQAEASNASHLQIEEFGVGTDVVNHRLVGQGNRFREGTVVWFWTNVLDGRPGDKIRHVWSHDGRSVAVAELNVNGTQWRTQSRRALPEGSTGDWTVEARDSDGHVIASVAFTCVAPNDETVR